MFEDVRIDIQVFYSVPLVFLSYVFMSFSVLMPVPGCFQYYSYIVEFDVRDCNAFRSSFIAQDCFDYPGFFAFPYDTEYSSSRSVKNFA